MRLLYLQSQRPVFSFHEEVAYTIAHGAALAGKRAFTSLKAHGFFKAANSVSDSLYSGTLAGFVSLVVDDKNGIQSDSIADTLGFVEGLGIPHKMANVEEVFDDILDGFMLSEELQLPFALIIDASDLDQPSSYPGERSHRSAVPSTIAETSPSMCSARLSANISGTSCSANFRAVTGRASPSRLFGLFPKLCRKNGSQLQRSMPSFLRPSDRLKERSQLETLVCPLSSPFRLTTASM